MMRVHTLDLAELDEEQHDSNKIYKANHIYVVDGKTGQVDEYRNSYKA
jgi:hypothetical protein